MWVFLWIFSFISTAIATPSGAEVALVLDSSGSMGSGNQITITDPNTGTSRTINVVANDPDRSSILGALVIEGLLRGGTDGYQVYFMPNDPNDPAPTTNSKNDIFNLQFSTNTNVASPLKQSIQQLNRSQKKDKTIIFLTDGTPSDIKQPYNLEGLIPKNRDFSIFAIGLYQSPESQEWGKEFLEALTSHEQDILRFTNKPADVVPFFMEGFAKVLGSKPEISEIKVGETKKLEIPKYVTEVFVALTSHEPKDQFTSTLNYSTIQSPQASGNNNCSLIPQTCRYYDTYRIQPTDPSQKSEMTLTVSGAKHPIDFSVIYRYDLNAELKPIPDVEVGEVVQFEGKLLYKNKVFDDVDFINDPKLKVFIETGKDSVPLEHVGNGIFQGAYTPTEPNDFQKATLVFQNEWMDMRQFQSFKVTGTLDLRLVVPNIDLGSWEGLGEPEKKCTVVDLSQSNNADVVPLTCTISNLPKGFSSSCTPSPNHAVAAGKQPMHYEVCIESPSCCGGSENPATILFEPTPARYKDKAAQSRITYAVSKTSFWNCYWKEILIGLGILTLLFIIIGYKRPHDFPEGMSFKHAPKKKALDKANTFITTEERNGKSGFYRNARLAFNMYGEVVVNTKDAILVLEAGPGYTTQFTKAAGLEIYDETKRKWVIVKDEDLEFGYLSRRIYRCGDRYFKFF